MSTKFTHLLSFLVVAMDVSPAIVHAQSSSSWKVDPVLLPDFMASPDPVPPSRIHWDSLQALPIDLNPLAEEEPDQLESLVAWNRSRSNPLQTGVVRELKRPRQVVLRQRHSMPGSPTEGLVRTDAVRVAGAYRLRLHLSDVRLPEGVQMWVYGQGGDFEGPFGLELLDPDQELWTPGVLGEVIALEIKFPAQATRSTKLGFSVDRVAEELSEQQLEASSPPLDTSCYIDSRCVPPADLGYRYFPQAVAKLNFVRDGKSLACTGALITDRADSFTPYLLTAEHCISSQKIAYSLIATWDYRPRKCGGKVSAKLPKDYGAWLLAAGKETDFAFLRLFTLKKGRAFLGWIQSIPVGQVQGVTTYRLSHPSLNSGPIPQSLTQGITLRRTAPEAYSCNTAQAGAPAKLNDQDYFVQTKRVRGGSYFASSGSPLILEGGYLIGQLWGWCGPDYDKSCGPAANEFSGSFYITYESIKQYLEN